MSTYRSTTPPLVAAAIELRSALEDPSVRTLELSLDRDDWLLLAQALEMVQAGLLVDELTQFGEQLLAALTGEDR